MIIPFGILLGIFIGLTYLVTRGAPGKPILRPVTSAHDKTLWKYQCIDTMKTSRDKARVWEERRDLEEHIAREIAAIKAMGGNCVAIATPYDEEFLPYLKKWVAEARKQDLIIWFRGNFSSWEGWFEYPKGMTEDQLLTKTEEFILNNPDLFQDGDVFTAAPEAENGGPFNQVEIDEHEGFRAFLIRENDVSRRAFEKIGKDVQVNWFSMNGGLAQRMMDQRTADSIGKLVTIDHYIKTAPEMGEFITYFYDKFGAKVVIGEFGAPIPEINGPMTDERQAEFIGELFEELYKHKDKVEGVSYWILSDGSTELLDENLNPKPAAAVVQQYFIPNRVSGIVSNTLGEPVAGASVMTSDGYSQTVTDENGFYELIIPRESVQISVFAENYKPFPSNIEFKKQDLEKNFQLEQTHESGEFKIKKFLKGLFN